MDTLEAGIGDSLKILKMSARGILETIVSSLYLDKFTIFINRSLLWDPQVPLWIPADKVYTQLITQAFVN